LEKADAYGDRLEEADQVISSGLIDGSRVGFGHWMGEIPLTKLNARRPAKGYADRLLGGPEVHPKFDNGHSYGLNMLPLHRLEVLLVQLLAIPAAVAEGEAVRPPWLCSLLRLAPLLVCEADKVHTNVLLNYDGDGHLLDTFNLRERFAQRPTSLLVV